LHAGVIGPPHLFEFINPTYARMVGRTDVALIGRPAREATPTVAGRDVDDIPARRTPWNDRARSPLTQMRLVQAGGKCVIHHSMFWI